MSTLTTTTLICDADDGEITPDQVAADQSTVLHLQDGGTSLDFHSPACLQTYGQLRLVALQRATATAVASVSMERAL